MRLALALPATFAVTDLGEGQYTAVIAAASAEQPVALSLYCSAIVPQPADPPAWCEQRLRDELPANASLVIKSRADHHTVVGWKVHLIEAEVVSAAGGPPLAVRLGAFYVFLEYVAFVMVRAASQAQLEPHRQQLLTVLLSGRADWSGSVVALAQLCPEHQGTWSPGLPPGIPRS